MIFPLRVAQISSLMSARSAQPKKEIFYSSEEELHSIIAAEMQDDPVSLDLPRRAGDSKKGGEK